jgi:hypothetical protein
MLNGCFGTTKVGAKDIDGIVHQNGKVLLLEKKFPHGALDQPWIRMVDALVLGGHSAIAFWCEDRFGKDISMMRVWGIEGYDPALRVQANLHDFRKAVSAWWRAVYVEGRV